MAHSSHTRAFQAYNSHNYPNRPAIKQPAPISSAGESLVFGRIPFSSIKTTMETTAPSSVSPFSPALPKTAVITPKRRMSTTGLAHLLPNRKGLPMTALATRRQNLWMSIAKNAQGNSVDSSSFPLRQQNKQPSLMRKKFLRLLLVISYLLSISLFAIGLATFYGFFWSGYSPSPSVTATTMTHTDTTVITIVSVTSNSTVWNIGFSLDDVNSDRWNWALHAWLSPFVQDLVIESWCDRIHPSMKMAEWSSVLITVQRSTIVFFRSFLGERSRERYRVRWSREENDRLNLRL